MSRHMKKCMFKKNDKFKNTYDSFQKSCVCGYTSNMIGKNMYRSFNTKENITIQRNYWEFGK